MKQRLIFLLSMVIMGMGWLPFNAASQELPGPNAPLAEQAQPAGVYPKVGLVLSGGGARGFAHIGVLKVLEELGLPVDYVVGTSMGSIVGGLYAIGYTAPEIEKTVNDVNWEAIFSDTPPRNLWSYQQKRASAKYMVEVGFSKKGFLIPKGLTAGQKISNLMTFLTLRASEINNFDQFPRPYRAVATDIVTGEEVVLEHGSLADAMRASMSVPGVFTPITIDGHLLVDGGVIKNLPVDIAKQLGADIIVAIDVSAPLRSQSELRNPLAILDQMVGLQMIKSTQAQRKLADVVIITDLGEYSSTSFANGPEIIALGEKSARAHLTELQALVQKIRLTRPATRAFPNSVLQDVKDITIDDIVVEGHTSGSEQFQLKQLERQKGQKMDPQLIEQSITEIFSTGKYETVKFALTPGTKHGKTLKLQLQEREQGQHLLRFGMNYESRFGEAEEDKIVFLLNATLNNLTGKGSSWPTDLQFVSVTKVQSEYFQPLGANASFFTAPTIYAGKDFQTIYENKKAVTRYERHVFGAGWRLGTFISRIGEVSFGYLLENMDASLPKGTEDRFADYDEMSTSFTARSRLDQLDKFPFPTSGQLLNIDYQWARKKFGGERDFQKLAFEYWRYVTLGQKHTVGLGVRAGTSFKTELRPYQEFTLGGRDTFVGYKVDELLGSHLGSVTLEYRRQFSQLPSAVGGGIFAIATANAGNVWQTTDEITHDFTLRYGGSLGLAIDTILGPVRADFSIGDGGRRAVYLNIGYKF